MNNTPKAKMIPFDNVEELIGHKAGGTSNSAVKLTLYELKKHLTIKNGLMFAKI